MSLDQKEITYSLTYKEMLEILKILDESPCQELRLELEGFKLEIIKGKEPLPSFRRSFSGPGFRGPFAGGNEGAGGAGPKNRARRKKFRGRGRLPPGKSRRFQGPR